MKNTENRVKTMTTKRGKDKKKREAQVNVRLTPEFYQRLQKACRWQEHKEGQLLRILAEWALPFYEKSESVKGLKAISSIDLNPDNPLITTLVPAGSEAETEERKERLA